MIALEMLDVVLKIFDVLLVSKIYFEYHIPGRWFHGFIEKI